MDGCLSIFFSFNSIIYTMIDTSIGRMKLTKHDVSALTQLKLKAIWRMQHLYLKKFSLVVLESGTKFLLLMSKLTNASLLQSFFRAESKRVPEFLSENDTFYIKSTKMLFCKSFFHPILIFELSKSTLKSLRSVQHFSNINLTYKWR